MKTKSTSQISRTLTRNAILLAITALALSTLSTFAATTTWQAGTGNWVTGANWDNGEPHSMTDAQINNGGTAQIYSDFPMAEALSLTLGVNASESGTVEVIPSHGDLSVGEAIFVGKGGTGKLTITQGRVTSATASIASVAGSNGTATVDGGSSTWAVSGEADVGGAISGTGGTGLLTVTNGGTVTAATVHVYASGTLTGNGTVNVNSGSGTATFDGTLAPKGGGTTLTFDGNLQLNSTATTQCNVTPQDPSTTPQVSVSKQGSLGGQVSLDGRLSVTMTGDFSSAPTRFTLLYADSVAVGHITFGSTSITYPTGQCWTPQITYDYTGGHVHVYLDRVVCTN